MRKIYNIAKGWFIFLFYNRSRMSKDRLKRCFKCDMRRGVVCGVCFCELHAKSEIRDEECPHPKGSKWKGIIYEPHYGGWLVGPDYFTVEPRYKFMKRIKQLFKNLVYLSKIDLKDKHNPIVYLGDMPRPIVKTPSQSPTS